MNPSSRRAGHSVRFTPYTAYAVNLSNPTQNTQLDPAQVQNSDGAYVWLVDDIARLKRFLVLGSDKGTYYISEQQLTKENGECIRKLIVDGQGKQVVELVRQFSSEGRTAKQEPLIFTLAMCARLGDSETKQAAYSAVEDVLRIPTHLFAFVEFCQLLSGDGTGWGRAHRRAISNWYNNKNDKDLRYLMTKYQSRNGWSHRDVLRLAHVKPRDEIHNLLYRYITQKEMPDAERQLLLSDEHSNTVEFLKAFESMKNETDENVAVEQIRNWNLVREHIPTNLLNSKLVWKELLQKMPLTALIRNLGKMTSIGLLDSNCAPEVEQVVAKLTSEEYLHKSRIHPMAVLIALRTYTQGHGVLGSLTWNPVSSIVTALDKAFYLSFKNVEPTGKRFLLAIDVSPSMSGARCVGSQITANEASAALAMITAATEAKCDIMGFNSTFQPLDLSPRRRLDDNMKAAYSRTFSGTDCALPMTWAAKNEKEYDVFIVYTDSETNAGGSKHPAQALRQYRNKMKIPHAKLIVMGMASNGFTIADPSDAGMLDVVGFDASVPQIIREFVMN